MPEEIAIAKELIEAANSFGILKTVKEKLIRQPDPALDALVTALEEISKIYDAFAGELNHYLSLFFDPSDEAAKSRAYERASLIALEGNEIKARMGKARGHSTKIDNIYHKYLTPWFVRVGLTSNENNEMFKLFHELHGTDERMLYKIDEVAEWLSKQAEATTNLVDARKFEEANERIRTARLEILPARREMARVMKELFDLLSEFTEMSRAVGVR